MASSLKKKTRGICKGEFTRTESSLYSLIGKQRDEVEILAIVEKLESAYGKLNISHKEYLETLEEDDIENAEAWMDPIASAFDEANIKATDYIKSRQPIPTPNPTLTSPQHKRNLRVKSDKTERPIFSGNVLEFHQFVKDFSFVYSADHDDSEQLYVLRRSVPQEAKMWILACKTTSEAFSVLKQQYGDPRIISDAVLTKINKMKQVPEDDARILITFYHEIVQAQNVLKELDRQSDLDNSTTLASIESKLSYNDRVKWARYQIDKNINANIQNFLMFLNEEILIKRIAGAQIRSGGSSSTSRGGAHVGSSSTSRGGAHVAQVEIEFPEDDGIGFENDEMEIQSQFPPSPSETTEEMNEYVNIVGAGINNSGNLQSASSTSTLPNQTQIINPCWICGIANDHRPFACKKYVELTVDDRLKFVRKEKACIFCLHKHWGKCQRRKPCDKKGPNGEECRYSHHPTLHGAKFETQKSGTGFTATSNVAESSILPIISATVYNPNKQNNCMTASILIDSGASLSLIKNECAQKLGLNGRNMSVTISKVGNVQEEYQTKLYTLHVRNENGGPSYKVKVIGIDEICNFIEPVNLEQYSKSLHVKMSDLHRQTGPPDLLIGIDHVKFHSGKIDVSGNVAVRYSIIGPILFGTPNDPRTAPLNHHSSINVCTRVSKSDPVNMQEFMGAEEMGISINPCCQNQKPGQKLLSPLERIEDERIRKSAQKLNHLNQWHIPIPWDKDPAGLKNNYGQALAHLESLEKHLRKDPELWAMYHEQIMDLERRGCAKKLTAQDIASYIGVIFYLTHRAVLRLDKLTTPCRVVFNSALKFRGLCLNDFQIKGPDLLNCLVGVIIRFRENPVAVMGDLIKMFQQILFSATVDANTHRFLWRNCENRAPDIYAMQVLIFGDKCSPALAQTAVNLTAEEYLDQYPEAAMDILICRYMDDLCNSYKNTEIAKKRLAETDFILSQGHFAVKQWASNCDLGTEQSSDTKLRNFGDSDEKVLGIVWDRESDKLRICSKVPKIFQGKFANTTDWTMPLFLSKRMAFSVCAGIFDMIGYTSPFVIRGKIEMQTLWTDKYDWDTDLPSETKEIWYKWFKELSKIDTVSFERCLTPDGAIGLPILVLFSDASSLAYGAVAFLSWELECGLFATRFVMAKSRVAPVKNPGIPRLELCSLVVAARLNNTVRQESRFDIGKTVIFSDSRIALAWVKSDSRTFKPYVSVRVGEIQMKTEKSTEFRFIPSEMNVADDLSRGLHIEELSSSRWTYGENFLCRREEEWPDDTSSPNETEKQAISGEQIRKSKTVAVTVAERPYHETYIRKFSTLNRAILVTAMRNRFITNIKTSAAKSLLAKGKQVGFEYDKNQKTGDITLQERKAAEKSLLIDAQKILIPLIKKNKVKTLCPTKNDDGIYHVKGRTSNLVSYESHNPAILPENCWFSTLVVRHVHQNCGHPGVAACTAKVLRRYWVIGAARIAKTVKNDCAFCREWDGKTEKQIMADLPNVRLQPHTPSFYFTAVDLFGPLKVKVGRNKTDKHYGVLFTCLMIRAVYIDIATDYSTPGFLQVLRRFLSIRGQIHTLYSDRGSQLVGADTELRRAVEGWDQKELKKFCHERQTEWEFFTPTAAHQNGCAESMIKTTKLGILRAIGDQTLAPLELQTVLFEIANLINQRPIGRIPNDPDDGHYLSPNDLLLGRASNTIPQGPFMETKNPRHRYEFCQKIVTSWWQQWYRDVFPQLVPRKKWLTTNRNVSIGDYVLLKDQNPIRGNWSRGLITAVFPGQDGNVRNVRVRTNAGEYERPVTKIVVLLPVDDQNYDDGDD